MKLRLHLILTLSSVAASQGPVINATNTTIHTIQVGVNGQLRFNPSTAFVPVGEVVEFDFYPMNHSVAQGSFDAPCSPSSGAFFSDYQPSSVGSTRSFLITINDTNPIYYYCSQGKHCQLGMVGVINPSSTNLSLSQADYANLSALAPNNEGPSYGVYGGVIEQIGSNGTATTSVTASGSATTTATSSATGIGLSAGPGTSATGSVTGTSTGSSTAGGNPTSTSSTAAAVHLHRGGTDVVLGLVAGLGLAII